MVAEEYGKYKIRIYGNKGEIDEAKRVLDELILTGNESKDRLVIQEAIDRNKVRADILYAGNRVWSYNRVVRDFKRALKSGPTRIEAPPRLVWPGHTHEFVESAEYNLTNYLYDFLSLECGSIAHFNKDGWIGTYPTKEDLKGFCKHNEFGRDILNHQPSWASDRQRIAKAILEMG